MTCQPFATKNQQLCFAASASIDMISTYVLLNCGVSCDGGAACRHCVEPVGACACVQTGRSIWMFVCVVRCADDGITIPVPILLEGEESVVEFIDLPYSGVSCTFSIVFKS